MCDIESRKAYFRQYYRNNKDKYKMLNGKKIKKPVKPKTNTNKKEEPQFSIRRGTFIVKFQ